MLKTRTRKSAIRMTTRGSKYNKPVEFNPGVAFKHNSRSMKTVNTKVDIAPELHSFMLPTETFITKWRDYEKIYTKKTGQKVQKKAQPLREMIVITDSHTTLEHLKTLTLELERLTGWRALHIAKHSDEGHFKTVNGKQVDPKEFITNWHAHIVFECYNLETGKSILLNPKQMSKMQDLASECLNMPRGAINSKRVHLEPEQYRQAQQDKDKAISLAIDENSNVYATLLTSKNQKIKNLTGINKVQEEIGLDQAKRSIKMSLLTIELNKMIETLSQENKTLKTANNALSSELINLKVENKELSEAKNEIVDYFIETKKTIDDLQTILDILGLGEIKLKQKIKAIKLKSKDDYKEIRQILKDSGIGTQQDYSNLKLEHEKILARLSEFEKQAKLRTKSIDNKSIEIAM